MKSDFLRFRRVIMDHHRRHGRHALPWRKTTDPYAILVSEIMLQQTQVDRVIPYFRFFLKRFPTVQKLARAKTSSALKAWQGLGYNRRALMLHRCAQSIVTEHGGALPSDYDKLKALSGLGPYTAGAVTVFAFNKPYPLIETNIRRTYIHHFFPDTQSVDDIRILPLVERTMDRRNPRVWFGALMDYGSWLARQVPNPNRKSKQYAKQARFEGSDRQIRGAILRILLTGPQSAKALFGRFDVPKRRFGTILNGLVKEGFIKNHNGKLMCA